MLWVYIWLGQVVCWIRVIFPLAIHSAISVFFMNLIISLAGLSCMEVDFLNQNPWMSSRPGVFQFAIFLSVALNPSGSKFTWRPSSSICNPVSMLLIHPDFLSLSLLLVVAVVVAVIEAEAKELSADEWFLLNQSGNPKPHDSVKIIDIRCIWSHATVRRLFILDRNACYHITVCKVFSFRIVAWWCNCLIILSSWNDTLEWKHVCYLVEILSWNHLFICIR